MLYQWSSCCLCCCEINSITTYNYICKITNACCHHFKLLATIIFVFEREFFLLLIMFCARFV
ncbi:hypothetical protein MtrunA17_Chr4g0039951 [Medicago truncatula]|uniref:Uncharacterized protein n=1 Tax=Medicago truncatula TaxID=3880 RepID=A0A396IDE8_MEDTR|nr:hypothetical protein MtrunA17_Chr4g0039951 [Medicago truncatula]